MNDNTFYKWRSKYGDMDTLLMKRMKGLEDKNRQLKKIYTKEKLKCEIAKKAIKKKWSGHLGWRTQLIDPAPITVRKAGLFVMCFLSVKPAIAMNQNGMISMLKQLELNQA